MTAPNHDFVLRILEGRFPDRVRLLDFGCGSAELVRAALERGHDAFGVDTFEGIGDDRMNERLAFENVGDRVRAVGHADGLPFPADYFDACVANMVFEHVAATDGFDAVGRALAAVLRPGGMLMTLMPTTEVAWEDHLKVPFVHWLNHRPGPQALLLDVFRRMGMGSSPHVERANWVIDAQRQLRTEIFHRRVGDYAEALAPWFTIEAELEPEWARDRLARHGSLRRLAPLVRHRLADPLLRVLVRRSACAVLLFRRTSVSSAS